MKRFLLFIYCLILFTFLPAFFTYAATPENYSMSWASSSSSVFTAPDNGLMIYGTYGENNLTHFGLYTNVTSCCTVFVQGQQNPLQGRVYIFTNDNSQGTYATWDFANHEDDPFALTFSNISWGKVKPSSLYNVPNVNGKAFGDYCPLDSTYYFTSFAITYDYSVNNCNYIVDDWEDLASQLAEDDFVAQNPINNGSHISYPEDALPFLAYSLKRSIVPNLNGQIVNGLAQVKETFTWDYTEKSPYKDDPTNYTFDIMAWTNFKTLNGFDSFDRDNLTVNDNNKVYLSYGGYNIAVNEYSFLYGDIGKAIYNKDGHTWWEDSTNSIGNGYFLAIRSRLNDSSKTSWWKIFIVQAGGNVFSTNKCINDNGDIVDAPTDAPNSNDDIGVSTGGIPNYSTDNNSSAAQDSTGDIYSGTDVNGQLSLSAVISNLREIVNGISQMALLVQSIFLSIPAWLMTLIWTSIGLLIAIGVAKHIIG